MPYGEGSVRRGLLAKPSLALLRDTGARRHRLHVLQPDGDRPVLLQDWQTGFLESDSTRSVAVVANAGLVRRDPLRWSAFVDHDCPTRADAVHRCSLHRDASEAVKGRGLGSGRFRPAEIVLTPIRQESDPVSGQASRQNPHSRSQAPHVSHWFLLCVDLNGISGDIEDQRESLGLLGHMGQ